MVIKSKLFLLFLSIHLAISIQAIAKDEEACNEEFSELSQKAVITAMTAVQNSIKFKEGEMEAVKSYGRIRYSEINRYLRNLMTKEEAKTYRSDKAFMKRIKLLNSAVRRGKVPGGIVLYRGWSLSNIELQEKLKNESVAEAELPPDLGFLSTSIDRKVAVQYANRGSIKPSYMDEMIIPDKGTCGLYLGHPDFKKGEVGAIKTEEEVLLPPKSKFKVISVIPNGNYIIRRMVMIDDGC